ncbi:hypothetical protein IPA_01170 [Ignicoccus pacificus DSM 13166]|uniref:Uncharacterized protein n=1 Tax=Ignicoccus pacificus DSM 13166 TaxID=940294 RepID=A0A977KBH8_9CREN|nr:hypothetical protein IPA_01170 [Ignicoccus pacificus DSM 13166]
MLVKAAEIAFELLTLMKVLRWLKKIGFINVTIVR